MDVLSGLLEGPRARSAMLLRAVLDPPFAVRVEDRAPLTVLALVRGTVCLVPDAGDAVRLLPGDVAAVRGPQAYRVADDARTPVQAVITAAHRSTTPDGRELCEAMDLGVRTWGNRLDAPTLLLVGTYRMPGEVSRPLLSALPSVVVVPAASWDCPFVPLLEAEVARDGPGQDAVLDRLLDLVLVDLLRVWFARPDGDAPGWYRAQTDPVVGPALSLLQEDPAYPWTVAALAARVGMSRAALARRFTDLVGEPPMAYLTSWRLALAADLLRDPHRTLGAVAREVGYGSPFALSSAFKRVRGVSPREHRAGGAA